MALPIYGYPGLVVSGVISILMLCMLIHLVYNECLEYKKENHSQSISIGKGFCGHIFSRFLNIMKSLPGHTTVSILALLAFSINALNFFLLSLYDVFFIENLSSDQSINHLCYSQLFINTSMTVGKISAYLFFIIRLYQVFKGSAMAISKKRLQIFAFAIALPNLYLAVLFTYAIAVVVGDVNKNNIKIKTFDECSEIISERMLDNEIFNFFKFLGIALYTLNSIAYSAIILRLFMSKVILLSLTFEEFEHIQLNKYSRMKSGQNSNTSNTDESMQSTSNSGNTITKQSSTLNRFTTESEREPESELEIAGVTPMKIISNLQSISEASKHTFRPAAIITSTDKSSTIDHGIKRTLSEKYKRGKVKRAQRKKEDRRLARIKRKNTAFLHTAIKTANLVILAVITNFIALFMSAARLPAYFFLIDTFCNSLSVYLSFKYTQEIYGCIFGHVVHDCYLKCCASICVCCCLPKTLPKDIQLILNQQQQKKRKFSPNSSIVDEDDGKCVEIDLDSLDNSTKLDTCSLPSPSCAESAAVTPQAVDSNLMKMDIVQMNMAKVASLSADEDG